MKSKKISKSILLAALSSVLALRMVSPAMATGGGTNQPVFDVTLPNIPTSAGEIVNPMRGLYVSYDSTVAPTPQPALVRYKRFLWSQIETSPHHFDFSPIDSELTKASAVNGKFAFRIMGCSAPGSANATIGVPSDFPAILKKGFFITETSSTGTSSWRLYVPDYNDPIYISRGKDLIDALAAKYNGDPRMAYVEAGLIGTWGEGNYSQMPSPTPSGAVGPYFGTAAEIVDQFCSRFTRTRVVSPTDIFLLTPTQPDEKTYAATYHNALEYALRKHPTIGMFRNSLGDPLNPTDWFTAPFSNSYVVTAGGAQRWQTAPFCAEWYGPPKPISAQLVLGATDIPATHVALVCNGALGPGPFAPTDIQQLQTDGILSGYRFQLDRVTATNIGGNSRKLNLTSYWENVGVTPAYDAWTIVYQLRQMGLGPITSKKIAYQPSSRLELGTLSDKIVYQASSRLDLRALLPTNGTPAAVQDILQIPSSVPPGNYQLSIVIKDSAKYYTSPLALATAGVQPDGSYNLAVISIQAPDAWNSSDWPKP